MTSDGIYDRVHSILRRTHTLTHTPHHMHPMNTITIVIHVRGAHMFSSNRRNAHEKAKTSETKPSIGCVILTGTDRQHINVNSFLVVAVSSIRRFNRTTVKSN